MIKIISLASILLLSPATADASEQVVITTTSAEATSWWKAYEAATTADEAISHASETVTSVDTSQMTAEQWPEWLRAVRELDAAQSKWQQGMDHLDADEYAAAIVDFNAAIHWAGVAATRVAGFPANE